MSRGRTPVTVGRLRVECRDHRTSQYLTPKGDPHRLPVSTQGAHRATRDGGSRVNGAAQGWVLMISADSHAKQRGGGMRRGRCREGRW